MIISYSVHHSNCISLFVTLSAIIPTVNVKLLWLIVEIPMQEETFVNAREI